MKLLTRTNIYFIALTLIVFSLGGKVFYERVHSINKFDASERLEQEKEKILNYINANHILPQSVVSLGDSVAFIAVAEGNEEKKTGYVKLFNSAEKEYEPFQTFEFTVNTGNQFYRATLYRPLLESDDLTTAIVQAMLIIGSCLLVVLLVSNFIISKIMWLPFYRTLEKIKSFDLTKENHLKLKRTGIAEFNSLNNVLETMSEKIASDYRNLKQFTENASHEIQTPLSIIQSKAELMMQFENLTPQQISDIQAVYQSAARLAKLNQALLLLAKIENNQFTESEPIQIDSLIKAKLDFFDEFIRHKNISVETKLEPLSIYLHHMLADILISNLISNAIKHNIPRGKIFVQISGNQLSIKNSGSPLTIAPSQLFQRFCKANQASDSLGLGLAIVSEICTIYRFIIDYKYSDGLHIISIRF